MEKIKERDLEKKQITNDLFKKAYSEFVENENRQIVFNVEDSSIQNKDLIIEVLRLLETQGIIKSLIVGLYSNNSFKFIPTDQLFLDYERENNLRFLHNEYRIILEVISKQDDFFILRDEDLIEHGSKLSSPQIEIVINSIFYLVLMNRSLGNRAIPNGVKSISSYGENLLQQLEDEKILIQNPDFLGNLESTLEDHSYGIQDYSIFKDGHMGWVFKGFNAIDEKCAIKIYKTPMNAENNKGYLREPLNLMKLKHPNIVKYHSHFLLPFHGLKYLVLIEEYIEGKTLQDIIDLLREENLSIKLLFIINILNAISHFKAKLNLHGDLTFTNIMVKEIFQPVLIDPGFSNQRFKNPDQIINDEKLFIINLVSKIFTPSERKNIDLDSLMAYDSLNEFTQFFQKATKIIERPDKVSKIQLEQQQVKNFFNNTMDVFKYRYSMKKFHEISQLYYPKPFNMSKKSNIYNEISSIHEKLYNMFKVMNKSTDMALEKIDKDAEIDWIVINKHFDYTSFQDLHTEYKDVYSIGFDKINQKLYKVANYLKEKWDQRDLEKYFRDQLEEFQEHNKFKLILLNTSNIFSNPFYQINHKYYIGQKSHIESNTISFNSFRSKKKIELKLLYKCQNPNFNQNCNIFIFHPNHIKIFGEKTNSISTNLTLNYVPKFNEIFTYSIEQFYRNETIPIIIKTESKTSSFYQIILVNLTKIQISVKN